MYTQTADERSSYKRVKWRLRCAHFFSSLPNSLSVAESWLSFVSWRCKCESDWLRPFYKNSNIFLCRKRFWIGKKWDTIFFDLMMTPRILGGKEHPPVFTMTRFNIFAIWPRGKGWSEIAPMRTLHDLLVVKLPWKWRTGSDSGCRQCRGQSLDWGISSPCASQA